MGIDMKRALMILALSCAVASAQQSDEPSPAPPGPQCGIESLGPNVRGMMGQSVCGEPCNEAALLTAEVNTDIWRVWHAGGPMIATYGGQDARRLAERMGGTYLCDVEVAYDFGTVRGRFHRLGWELARYEENELGVFAGDYDVRQLILGMIPAKTEGRIDGVPSEPIRVTVAGAALELYATNESPLAYGYWTAAVGSLGQLTDWENIVSCADNADNPEDCQLSIVLDGRGSDRCAAFSVTAVGEWGSSGVAATREQAEATSMERSQRRTGSAFLAWSACFE